MNLTTALTGMMPTLRGNIARFPFWASEMAMSNGGKTWGGAVPGLRFVVRNPYIFSIRITMCLTIQIRQVRDICRGSGKHPQDILPQFCKGSPISR